MHLEGGKNVKNNELNTSVIANVRLMDGSEEGGRELSFSPIQHEFGISHPFLHEEDSAHQASFLAPF